MFTIRGADGKEYGPVTADTVRQWIATGRANAQTGARREGGTDWKTLGDYPDFAAPPPAIPLRVPVGTAPVAGELELAGRGARLLAQIIDGLIACAIGVPSTMLYYLAARGRNEALIAGGTGLIVLAFLALIGIQIYLLTTRGQAIGKKLMGIRIVIHGAGTNPGFVKVVLLRIIVNGFIGVLPFVGVIYSLVDICFIFRDDRRCIHDLIAGTMVVKA
ncbi:MAG: RDD family protein [Lacunisphaera sp.]|nr:RDD family protein [Lacunisphaera sp.]